MWADNNGILHEFCFPWHFSLVKATLQKGLKSDWNICKICKDYQDLASTRGNAYKVIYAYCTVQAGVKKVELTY